MLDTFECRVQKQVLFHEMTRLLDQLDRLQASFICVGLNAAAEISVAKEQLHAVQEKVSVRGNA